jgi:hypothetical protein
MLPYLGNSEEHVCIPGCCKIQPCETWQQLPEYNCVEQQVLGDETEPLSINRTGTFFVVATAGTAHISVSPWLDITQPSLKDEPERAVKRPVMDGMPQESIHLGLTGRQDDPVHK